MILLASAFSWLFALDPKPYTPPLCERCHQAPATNHGLCRDCYMAEEPQLFI